MRKFSVVPGLFAGLVMLSAPAVSSAGVFLSIRVAPPVLEVYEQPPCPTDGYLWQPGYWGYGDAGYYWIPGVWVAPPQAGFLWTPGYWGFADGLYAFNAGYWGPTVGFYGGVNYGFGYGGSGFYGGRWQGGHFAYNTAVSRVNTTVIHTTYNQTVPNRGNNRTSFNGGPGGIGARPSSAEATTARQHGQSAARPVSAPSSVNSRGAEPQSRTAARVSPGAARPEATAVSRPAPAARAAAPERAAARPEQAAVSRPAPAARAVAPERAAARPAAAPQARAAAPERAAVRPAEGKEERR